MFYLLLCVTENVKQSHAVRGGRFRIEFQPGQGNLNHMYGNQVTHTTFLLSFQSVDPADTPSPTTESDHSVPVRRDIKINPTSTRRVPDRSTRRSNQVLKLTDYHISRYVASTFKRLTKWATQRDLNHFLLHQRGITTTQPRLLSLYFSRNLKSVNSYMHARGRNHSTSTVPN